MREQQKIRNLEQEVQRLTLAFQTATVDRDYYRAQRDRQKEAAENWHASSVAAQKALAEARQGMRQIVTAVESNSADRYSAILRIARTNSGA